MTRTTLLALVLAAGAAIRPCSARQSYDDPYSALELSAGGALNVNRVGIHTWWHPDPGASARVAVPFEVGYLELGGRYLPLTSWYPEQPDWTATLVFGGWGLRWSPTSFLRWSPTSLLRLSGGLRAGLLRMHFDVDTFAGVATESELSAGPVARMEVFPVRFLGFFVEGSWERTFTSLPIDWVHVTAGTAIRVRTGSWLRRIVG